MATHIYSEASKAIIARLKQGPATNRQLQEAAYTHSGDVARRLIDLAQSGYVERIDGGSGRGTRAVYALKGER